MKKVFHFRFKRQRDSFIPHLCVFIFFYFLLHRFVLFYLFKVCISYLFNSLFTEDINGFTLDADKKDGDDKYKDKDGRRKRRRKEVRNYHGIKEADRPI